MTRRIALAVLLLVATALSASVAQATRIQLPGLAPLPAPLAKRLLAAWKAQGANAATTTHRNDDGTPRYLNRLILSDNPYLQQHALNPVNWYPWSDEAFSEARRTGKPVLVSIGYATCHWCHVMERESFDDPAIAELLNRHFIAVKVDREERPDIDALYINAVWRMTKSAGWPLNVFVTPDRKPFYGGTYFPAKDLDKRPGFANVLQKLADAWRERRDSVIEAGASLAQVLNQTPAADGEVVNDGVLQRGAAQLAVLFDKNHGGFGKSPKFPQPHVSQFLLRYGQRSGNPGARDMASFTLDHVARGGIFDHLGGGFHRYSTDAEWRVPHYEKMLYDQALLARVFVEATRATGQPVFGMTARQTLDFVLRELAAPSGGFYSAIDADSGGEEGAFYTWTRAEILAAVGPGDGEWIADFFGIDGNGARQPLSIPVVSDEFLKRRQMERERFVNGIVRARSAMLAVRQQRPRPARDDKILTAWNGMTIAALADASVALESPAYADAARRAASFLLHTLRRDGRLMRSYRGSVSSTPGFLDDYAWLILGLHQLYEATLETEWLAQAQRLAHDMVRLFGDPSGKNLLYSASDHEKLIAPAHAPEDTAVPAASSVAAYALLRLGHVLQDRELEARGRAILRANGQDVQSSPAAYTFLLQAIDFAVGPRQEIVIAGDPDEESTRSLIRTVRKAYLPRAALVLHAPADAQIRALIPFIAKQGMNGGRATAYVCEDYECRLPVTGADALRQQLAAASEPVSQSGDRSSQPR